MNSFVLAGIFGLGVLVIAHECGHLFAARAFGMRVLRFSIGFGPALWKHEAKKSGTIYQIALIPFLAYVQIAGMNPFEENDPEDRESYANASLFGRIVTILAGSFANYVLAALLFFSARAAVNFAVGVPTTTIKEVVAGEPAKAAGFKEADKIVSINGQAIQEFEQMLEIIGSNANHEIEVGVERAGEKLALRVTPLVKEGQGRIGVKPAERLDSVSAGQAALECAVQPAKLMRIFLGALGRIVTGKEKGEFKGPVGIVQETAGAASQGFVPYIRMLGLLSTSLALFNLLPLPGLDGGRFAFLAYEAVTRQRPNARMEANVHALGVLMLLALIAVVSFFDIRGN